MSYINDALSKIQKEKESPYASYGHVLSAESRKPGTGKKRTFAAILVVVLFLAAGLAAWFYWPDNPKIFRTVPPAQHADALAVKPVPGVPAVVIPKPPVDASAETQAMPPDRSTGERTPALSTVPETAVNTVIPGPKLKKEALPQPAPVDVRKFYEQALQAQREGRLEEAKELYKKVLQREPRHLQALNNLGVVYLKMKRYKWAIMRFNDALAVKSNYVDAHYNLACLYAQKNDTKQGIYYLKNAVDFNPEVRQWASQDEDLKNLAGLPEFRNIIQVQGQ